MDQIEIIDVVSLKDKDSLYLKPFRLHYKQNGKSLIWDCIKIHDSVSILIYNTSRNVLVFVRQFRPAILLSTLSNIKLQEDWKEKAKENLKNGLGFSLELCSGIIDKDGLSPVEVAREEIIEETGYEPPLENLQFIATFRTGIGTSGSLQHLYYCQVDDSMRVSSGGGIDDEFIDVIEYSIEESKKQIYANDGTTGLARTVEFRFALCWFINHKLPEISG